MQKMYFIFYVWDATYYSVLSFLHNVKSLLTENNIFYNPDLIPQHQLYSHDYFLGQVTVHQTLCNQKNADDKRISFLDSNIKTHLQRLDGEAASGKQLLHVSALPQAEVLEYLLQRLEQLPHIRRLEKQAVVLMGRQDGELLSRCISNWKRLTPLRIRDVMLQYGRASLDTSWGVLRRHFGSACCHLLPHQTAHPQRTEPELLERLCACLPLPAPSEREISAGLPVWPRSFPGLDMLSACYDVPFSFKGQQSWDIHAFRATLRHVEDNEGYPPALFLPRPEAPSLLQACHEGNQRLARMLGQEELFRSPHPLDSFPDLPAALPEMTPGQCRAFVSALEPDFRTALLRFFRDKEPLHSTERILAQELENFRSRLFVDNPFSWPRKSAPLAVLTLCWNQGKYITQCMESVAEQHCKLPIEHIIVDDCSTDDSASRIDDFASRHAHVRPFYLQEHASRGENVRLLFSRCTSYYAALCDGDDYFTDPCKLQKQLDFLQQNKTCALCFHPVRLVYEDGSPSRLYPPEDMLPGGIKKFYMLKDLFTANMIQTNSVMYRWRFRQGLPPWFDPTLIPGDWYWHLLHAEQGSIGYLPDVMSVYRRHGTSFFAASEKDHVRHRGVYGLHELRLYATVDQHFKGRYHAPLSRLATGVFSDLVMSYLKGGDDSLLKKGLAICPGFGREFMQKLHQTTGSQLAPGQ